MKVFISWSGRQSRALAQILREWIALAVPSVEPWTSESDIEAGDRWAQTVAAELAASDIGILCLTKENISAPWLLFEAGALAKTLERSRVIPLLLDVNVREVIGPLAQFQAVRVEKAGLWEVVSAINGASLTPMPDSRLRQLFEALWPRFELRTAAIPHSAPLPLPRPAADILEELVTTLRNVDTRMRTLEEQWLKAPNAVDRHRRARVSSFLMHELASLSQEPYREGIQALLIGSIVRDAAPWLYEMAVSAYQAALVSGEESSTEQMAQFKFAARLMINSRFTAEELGIDKRTFNSLVREIERLVGNDRSRPAAEPI
jgi:hypothetical protein